jgi:amino acid transporter
MIFGSLAIAFVLPKEQISLVDGVMRAFDNFLQAYHMPWVLPILIVLLLIGSLGSMINWIISPAKGLLMAAQHDYLPKSLCTLNKYGVASNILILQAVLVTLLCSGFLLFPNVNAIYWLFTDLSTELYMMMYVLMFVAAWRIKSKFPGLTPLFSIPGGKIGYYLVCFLGLLGCLITLVVGFIPPEQMMEVGGANHFRIIFSLGIIFMLLPTLLVYLRKRYRMKHQIA